jgi:thiamine-monophosphate kinase
VPLPAGDDLAVINWRGEDLLLVGVDQVLDGVHVDSGMHSPQQIGRKAMNRNLSDCAAMACLPAAALAAVALSRGVSLEYAQQLYAGLRAAGDVFDCPIIGGDTASWEGRLVLTVMILGRSAGIAPITRRGARPGDGIFVTGPLGGSILGRHMSFIPRIHEARRLAACYPISAMIDISDGLSRDLRQICQGSGVGAVVEAERVPIHPEAHLLAEQDGLPALDHALHDGEDHELLLTCAADELEGCVRIGRITAAAEILLRQEGDRPLEARAWEHKL